MGTFVDRYKTFLLAILRLNVKIYIFRAETKLEYLSNYDVCEQRNLPGPGGFFGGVPKIEKKHAEKIFICQIIRNIISHTLRRTYFQKA